MSQASDRVEAIDVDGRPREYVCHVPDRAAARPVPLLIVLHGRRSTAREMRWITHFDAIADRHGFAVVYPQGYDRSWNDGRGITPAEREGVDDIGFIRALVSGLIEHEGIDPARIGATGLSNGGVMCHRLALELGDRIGTIAPVAGPMPKAQAGKEPAYAVSVLLIHGTADRFLPIEGGRSRSARRPLLRLLLSDARLPGGDVLSLAETATRWRTIDGCDAEPSPRYLPATQRDPTSVEVVRYDGGRGGTAVEIWTIEAGGHTWPGGPRGMGLGWLGRTSYHFDAGEVIWNFLEQQGRPANERRIRTGAGGS